MVDIKTAVAAAMAFAKEFLGPERTANIRLEEVESSSVEGEEVWLVTLSNAFVEQGPLASMRAAVASLGVDLAREYKVFTVAKGSGEVLSMKIRVLSSTSK
jgi:hypothetical protein